MSLITFEAGTLLPEVKARLIETLTNVSSEITGIPKASFFISIREMPDENVAIGGKTVKKARKNLPDKNHDTGHRVLRELLCRYMEEKCRVLKRYGNCMKN